MGKTVIVSAVRTPFGKLGGSVSGLKAAELGGERFKQRQRDVQKLIPLLWGACCKGAKDSYLLGKPCIMQVYRGK